MLPDRAYNNLFSLALIVDANELLQRSISRVPFGSTARDWHSIMLVSRSFRDRTKSRCSTSPPRTAHLQTPQRPSEHLTSICTPAEITASVPASSAFTRIVLPDRASLRLNG